MILLTLLEASRDISERELTRRLGEISNAPKFQRRALELLLWHGVLGFRRETGEAAFIHSSGYNMRKYLALIEKHNPVYVVNPAFWKGLEIRSADQTPVA